MLLYLCFVNESLHKKAQKSISQMKQKHQDAIYYLLDCFSRGVEFPELFPSFWDELFNCKNLKKYYI